MAEEAPHPTGPVPPQRSERPIRGIPWRRLFLEGAVIVASILLAFGIDAWWSERQERNEEERLLEAVLNDARANLAILDQNSVYHNAALEVEREILRLAGSSPDAISVAKADSLIADLVWWLGSNHWNTGALQALVAGGRLEAIDDEELRRTLTSWARLIEYTVMVEEQEGVFFNQAFMPFLRSEARVAQIAQISQVLPGGGANPGGITTPSYGEVDWWPEKRDHRPLLISEGFQNLVLQKLWIQSDILAQYDQFSEQLQALIDRIEAQRLR